MQKAKDGEERDRITGFKVTILVRCCVVAPSSAQENDQHASVVSEAGDPIATIYCLVCGELQDSTAYKRAGFFCFVLVVVFGKFISLQK